MQFFTTCANIHCFAPCLFWKECKLHSNWPWCLLSLSVSCADCQDCVLSSAWTENQSLHFLSGSLYENMHSQGIRLHWFQQPWHFPLFCAAYKPFALLVDCTVISSAFQPALCVLSECLLPFVPLEFWQLWNLFCLTLLAQSCWFGRFHVSHCSKATGTASEVCNFETWHQAGSIWLRDRCWPSTSSVPSWNSTFLAAQRWPRTTVFPKQPSGLLQRLPRPYLGCTCGSAARGLASSAGCMAGRPSQAAWHLVAAQRIAGGGSLGLPSTWQQKRAVVGPSAVWCGTPQTTNAGNRGRHRGNCQL